MSYIPPICDRCGNLLNRISNVNPNLFCIECKQKFNLIREINYSNDVTKLKKEVIK